MKDEIIKIEFNISSDEFEELLLINEQINVKKENIKLLEDDYFKISSFINKIKECAIQKIILMEKKINVFSNILENT